MHKPILFSYLLWSASTAGLAAAPPDKEILDAAYRTQMEFRAGDLSVARPLVETLEKAVTRSKDNARLWEALGHAYMSLQGSLYAGPPDFPTMISVGERARAAYARSLALDPDSGLVRASHGMSMMVTSQLKGDGPGIMAGIDEMNAAVRQYPKSTAVRLTRGFTIIHLPPDMRDTPAVIEDLRYILATAPGGRPEDVLHVLLGDVYAETGNFPAARTEYQQVSGASAFAAEQAKARLDQGTVTPESITRVRMGLGTQCAMCHAPGTDK